jgi:hypothetical protein
MSDWIESHLRVLVVAFTVLNIVSAGVNFYFYSLLGWDVSAAIALVNCASGAYCGFVAVRYWSYI